MLPTMLELFGAEQALLLLGRAARLIGLQFYDDVANLLSVPGSGARDFAFLLAGLAAAQGEDVEIECDSDRAVILQRGWRLMFGVGGGDAMFEAWNALWQGALAVHNRQLKLTTERRENNIHWHISPKD
jgi:hypothetical protein